MVMLGFKRDWMRNSAECRQYVDILFAGFRHNLSIGILRVKQGFDYSKIIASEEVSKPSCFIKSLPEEYSKFIHRKPKN